MIRVRSIVALLAVTTVLAGCAPVAPKPIDPQEPTVTPEVVYELPADCNVSGLISQAEGWEAFDQTEDGVQGVRDCAVGTPNSDVGVWFGFKTSDADAWSASQVRLKTEGYKEFDAQVSDATFYILEDTSLETGPACKLAGYINGVEITSIEPWTECDDNWNRELTNLLVEHVRG
jgi:hypothetical protein